jgi:hypothetical protein
MGIVAHRGGPVNGPIPLLALQSLPSGFVVISQQVQHGQDMFGPNQPMLLYHIEAVLCDACLMLNR